MDEAARSLALTSMHATGDDLKMMAAVMAHIMTQAPSSASLTRRLGAVMAEHIAGAAAMREEHRRSVEAAAGQYTVHDLAEKVSLAIIREARKKHIGGQLAAVRANTQAVADIRMLSRYARTAESSVKRRAARSLMGAIVANAMDTHKERVLVMLAHDWGFVGGVANAVAASAAPPPPYESIDKYTGALDASCAGREPLAGTAADIMADVFTEPRTLGQHVVRVPRDDSAPTWHAQVRECTARSTELAVALATEMRAPAGYTTAVYDACLARLTLGTIMASTTTAKLAHKMLAYCAVADGTHAMPPFGPTAPVARLRDAAHTSGGLALVLLAYAARGARPPPEPPVLFGHRLDSVLKALQDTPPSKKRAAAASTHGPSKRGRTAK